MKRNTSRYFKSVNLGLDIEHPDRFLHYYPTSKSMNVIKAIVGDTPDQASIVVASFGSGKSLAAGIAAMIVNNESVARKQLQEIAKRIKRVDCQLGEFAERRAKRHSLRGLPVLLEGHQNDLTEALLSQSKSKLQYLRTAKAQSQDVITSLETISERARKQKIDHIAIVWDEFGQHLEALVATGKAESLLVVQQVAEWVARQSKPTATLTLLLHQNLFQYVGNLSQGTRSSWRKIEGRFESIRYVEDSDEMYELIAKVVSELRPTAKLPAADHFSKVAKNAIAAGLFGTYTKRQGLAKILRNAYPLLPATLYALPIMAARLAQNERTIFTFLREAKYNKQVSLYDLYQYFAASMQVDTGVGGSYRRWLETESALSKVATQNEKEILTATALLGLGKAGERTSIGKRTLSFAVTGATGLDTKATKKIVDDLIKRKLLLYRKNNDDISVWHGTDINIRSHLKEMIDRQQGSIDLVGFLRKEHPAPSWRPLVHNVSKSIRRYFQGKFMLANELGKLEQDNPALLLKSQEDGVIIYCLAANRKEIKEVTNFAKNIKGKYGSRLVIVVPTSPLSVAELIAEINALRELQSDEELLAADPFMMPELQYMVDAAQENLTIVLQRLTMPDGINNIWIANGKQLKVPDEYELQQVLSGFANKTYKFTPEINNELIVKHKLSQQMVNARKKLILGILERSGLENLGFDLDAMTPDATLFRTVLLRTRLYVQEGKEESWNWVVPDALRKKNPGLAAVWGELEDFFTQPAKNKEFSNLIETLVSPPYGTRMGVLPILLAAGMKAFGKAIAIRWKGSYLPDILASQIEDICALPSEFTVDVFKSDKKFKEYFISLNELFSREKPESEDLVRQLYDTIIKWRSQLPDSALTTQHVSKKAQALQRELRGEIDPVELALKAMPLIVGYRKLDIGSIPHLTSLVHEIEVIIDGYTSNAISTIYEQLAIHPQAFGNMLQRVHDWANCFMEDQESMEKYGHKHRAILSRALEANNGQFTDASFARALSAILLGKNFEQWDDASARLFQDGLREAVSQIEHAALTSPNPPRALAPLLRGRIKIYEEVLKRLDKGVRKGTKQQYARKQKKVS